MAKKIEERQEGFHKIPGADNEGQEGFHKIPGADNEGQEGFHNIITKNGIENNTKKKVGRALDPQQSDVSILDIQKEYIGTFNWCITQIEKKYYTQGLQNSNGYTLVDKKNEAEITVNKLLKSINIKFNSRDVTLEINEGHGTITDNTLLKNDNILKVGSKNPKVTFSEEQTDKTSEEPIIVNVEEMDIKTDYERFKLKVEQLLKDCKFKVTNY